MTTVRVRVFVRFGVRAWARARVRVSLRDDHGAACGVGMRELGDRVRPLVPG